MSVSFQLSVTSTLGVLLASDYETKIYKKTEKIKNKPLKSTFDYILCSLLISISAGVFTLPVSSYYFGVFSIISPLANIFCVKLAFYGMLSGTVATALAFIDNFHIKNIAIFIFDITEYILNTVVDISKAFSSFKYCTIPVHKEWLVFSIITSLITAVPTALAVTVAMPVFASYTTSAISESLDTHSTSLFVASSSTFAL